MNRLKKWALVVAAVSALGAAAYGQQPQDGKMMGLKGTSWLIAIAIPGHHLPRPTVFGRLSFQDDGRITGFSGCIRFIADYTVSGSALKLGPVGTKWTSCVLLAQTMAEQGFLRGLESAKSWRVEDGDLVLWDAANEPVVRLRPAKK